MFAPDLTQTMPPPANQPGTRPERRPPVRSAGVLASLNFLGRSTERPVVYMPGPGRAEVERRGEIAVRQVLVRDGRPAAPGLSIDREGFALTGQETAVTDFEDPRQLEEIYFPEMERLVKEETGARRVVVFDHNLRLEGGESVGRRGPVRMVHNDYTARSGPRRLRDLLGDDEAEALARTRFAIVNVWRPIRGPVLTAPLALAEAGSIAPEELVPVDLVYPDRVGEIYYGAYDPAQRWVYFPQMRTDEAVLIKGYDSVEDGRARFTLHSAFDDPTSPPGGPPRQSIEVRTFAFF